MSTHANIVMPYGQFVIYKHFDGYPKSILPPLVRCVAESSIFLRKRTDDEKSLMFRGSEEDLLEEMGFLVTRIITQFAVLDYMMRSSTGIKFEPRDISGIVSPTKICTAEDMSATYTYRIQKNGDILVCSYKGEFRVPYKSDLSGVLDQLVLAAEEDPD